MLRIAEMQDVFLRLYEANIASGESSVGYLTRIHRKLEQLGTSEKSIEAALFLGLETLHRRMRGELVLAPDTVH